MPRPKKVKTEVLPELGVITENTPIPVPDEAVITPPKVEMRVESAGVPATVMPKILAGVCEFCGPGRYDPRKSPGELVENYRVDPDTQLGNCQHYKGIRMRCSYCPISADWKDNIIHRSHNVYVSPLNPQELIVVCDDMRCQDKHIKRFTPQI